MSDCIFTSFAYELFKVKMKIVNNTRNTYLGQNTSKYCSQIIVVHVHHARIQELLSGGPGPTARKQPVECFSFLVLNLIYS